VYDTSISTEHAQAIRNEIEHRGVTSIRVVLSHHHKDHVAGTEVFADCEIIASEETARALRDKHEAFANSSPSIDPVIMPTTVLTASHCTCPKLNCCLLATRLSILSLTWPNRIVWMCIWQSSTAFLHGISRPFSQIMDPLTVSRAGGYDPSFIGATRDYVENLLRCKNDRDLSKRRLSEFVAADIESGALEYFEPYEQVHASNVKSVLEN